MQKPSLCQWQSWLRSPFIAKTLLVMKLTAVFLTVFMVHASARVSSQNISFSGKNVGLESVLSAVERQTGFVFVYKRSVLRTFRPVSISANEMPLTEFLTHVFETQPLDFGIKGKNVFIYTEHARPRDKKPAAPTFIADTLIDVQGKIVNERQEPIEGATVAVKGSKKAATSDAYGVFRLEDIESDATLVVSSVNMEIFETRVRGRRMLAINLQ